MEQGKITGANVELAVEWISLLAALCGVPMAKTVVNIARISIGVVILALRICVGLSPYQLLVESYDDILDLAIKEAALWKQKDNTMQPMSMVEELDLQTMSKEEKLEIQGKPQQYLKLCFDFHELLSQHAFLKHSIQLPETYISELNIHIYLAWMVCTIVHKYD